MIPPGERAIEHFHIQVSGCHDVSTVGTTPYALPMQGAAQLAEVEREGKGLNVVKYIQKPGLSHWESQFLYQNWALLT